MRFRLNLLQTKHGKVLLAFRALEDGAARRIQVSHGCVNTLNQVMEIATCIRWHLDGT